jgi:hypothetical protein
VSVLSRSLIAATACVVLAGLSACSGGDQPPSGQAKPSGGIAGFDPCQFFTPEELTAAGVSAQGKPYSKVSFEPGCVWEGEKMDVVLQKNAEETVDSYAQHGSFDRYDKMDINGRRTARAITAGAEGTGGCSTMLDSGGGVVILNVVAATRNSVPDTCAESEKIAKLIEPRLPK